MFTTLLEPKRNLINLTINTMLFKNSQKNISSHNVKLMTNSTWFYIHTSMDAWFLPTKLVPLLSCVRTV